MGGSAIDPSQFYTGLVAELYAPLRSSDPDPEVYADFVGVAGEPALELGCGDGDPLLALRRRGLDIEGVDSSAEMLERCRSRADAAQLEVTLHHQRMQDLDLPRRYRSVYLAGASFNLLTTDEDAVEALHRIRSHLTRDGSALIPLTIPQPTPTASMGRAREVVDASGATIRVTPVMERRDERARWQETTLRYERQAGDELIVVDRPWLLHWHTQAGFRSLAREAGLSAAAVLDERGQPATPDATTFAFWLQPSGG